MNNGTVLKKVRKVLNTMGVYLIPLIMFAILSITSEYFLTSSNIINLMMQVAVVGILAVGQTFVIVTGGIDLSVSSLLSFTGCLAIGLYNDMAVGLLAPLLVAILVGAAVGFCNGIFVSKMKMEPFIVTLATQSIVQALVLFYTDGKPKYINSASELVTDVNYGSDFRFIGKFFTAPIIANSMQGGYNTHSAWGKISCVPNGTNARSVRFRRCLCSAAVFLSTRFKRLPLASPV